MGKGMLNFFFSLSCGRGGMVQVSGFLSTTNAAELSKLKAAKWLSSHQK